MPSEEEFEMGRAVISSRIEECITVAELLLGLSSDTHGCIQSFGGDFLGFDSTAEQQMIDNWVYETDAGPVTLEVSIAPGCDWHPVVTVTTTDGVSEVFVLEDDEDYCDFPGRGLLLDLLKRFVRSA